LPTAPAAHPSTFCGTPSTRSGARSTAGRGPGTASIPPASTRGSRHCNWIRSAARCPWRNTWPRRRASTCLNCGTRIATNACWRLLNRLLASAGSYICSWRVSTSSRMNNKQTQARESSMTDLNTHWLGLALRSPVVIGASPLSDDLDSLRACVEAGAGAVVMHSLFEEQLIAEQMAAHRFIDSRINSDAEALSFFPESQMTSAGSRAYLKRLELLRASQIGRAHV